MRRIIVKEPVVVLECFGEWSEKHSTGFAHEPDIPWQKRRQHRDYTLVPGEYEIERIPNPYLDCGSPQASGTWEVLRGTKIGLGDWGRLISEGKVEVLE